MGNLDIVSEQFEALRIQVIDCLGMLFTAAQKFGLSTPPPALLDAQHKLQENCYRVLVVGETKRGKSTFINAFVGEDLLPVGLDTPTAQVFRIRRAEVPAYRVRYIDGTAQAIKREELVLYGSQQSLQNEGLLPLDQVIHWIEVDTVSSRLPRGIDLLDTPGIGAIYATHAEITQRFVPGVDAVIFVLDSERPIIQSEVEFIDSLLQVTRHIFFIQTKIDQYDVAVWQETQERNRDILKEHFQRKIADLRIWPISSTNLMRAFAEYDEAYMRVSRYEALESALEAFLARVSGYYRVRQVLRAASSYAYAESRKMEVRLDAAEEARRQASNELYQILKEKKEQFEAEWGVNGHERQRKVEDIYKRAAYAQTKLYRAVTAGGELESRELKQIANLQSLDEARSYSRELASNIINALLQEWSQESQSLQRACSQILGTIYEQAEASIAPSGALSLTTQVREIKIQTDIVDLLVYFSSDAVEVLANTVALLVLFFTPPLATVIMIPTIILTVVKTVRLREGQINKAIHEEPTRYLREILEELRRQLFTPDPHYGYKGRIEVYFDRIIEARLDAMRYTVAQKLQEMQHQLELIAAEAMLDKEKQRAYIEQLHTKLVQWTEITTTIEALLDAISDLYQQMYISSQ